MIIVSLSLALEKKVKRLICGDRVNNKHHCYLFRLAASSSKAKATKV